MAEGWIPRELWENAVDPMAVKQMRLEDLYDLPDYISVRLVGGGPHAGMLMEIPADREREILAVPDPPADPIGSYWREGPAPAVTLRVTYYRWSGSILDDGTRVFTAI